ncbi:integral membrane protein [Streptococcus pneumoniae]|nr:integral membrane protein [Streptococcus pneumoniae]CIW12100.1 integral membrane protein [Streptococcus pneumoniae]
MTIFVLFVIGAATYGSLTADKKIILKQGGSAILALISILLFKIHLKVDSNLANPF